MSEREKWSETRAKVRQRSGGICERCKERRAEHVHHLRYWPDHKRGGEPLDWLQDVCLPCHGHYHPNHTFRSKPEQMRIAAHRKKKGTKRPTCSHCGNLWTRERHKAICVKFGLDAPYLNPKYRNKR